VVRVFPRPRFAASFSFARIPICSHIPCVFKLLRLLEILIDCDVRNLVWQCDCDKRLRNLDVFASRKLFVFNCLAFVSRGNPAHPVVLRR
jgi:hypothetical protein